MGVYGVDSYDELIYEVVNKSKEVNPDIIIVNGDLVAHGFAADPSDNDTIRDDKWTYAKSIIDTCLL